MPSIKESLDNLRIFSENENVAKIITELDGIESSTDIQDETIENLRKQLKALLSKENIKSNNISLADAAYDALLALAEIKPLNEEDPVTQETIPSEDRIVVSTGHQFSIKSLLEYHNSRGYRGSSLGETNSKWLLNPITNLKFDQKDVKHIQEVARIKDIEIHDLKTEGLAQLQNLTSVSLSTSHSLFQQPLPHQAQQLNGAWRRAINHWDLYDSGAEVNRDRKYINEHATHIHSIQLFGYTDGTYSVGLIAGHNGDMGWDMPTIEHNY